ncbi:MAG: AI-2E family transporter [Planctomycetota bacterium]|nr:AI-2E family transporter [Planctomycetota bacterium]
MAAADPQQRPGWARLHLWQIQWVRDLLLLGAVLGLLRLGHTLSLVTVPVLLAALLAYFLEPLVARGERSTPLGRKGSASAVLGAGLVLALVPLLFGASFAVLQGARVAVSVSRGSSAVVASVRAPEDEALAAAVPESWRGVRGFVLEVRERAEDHRPEDDDLLGSALRFAGADAGDLARLAETVLHWVRTHSERVASGLFETGGTAARLAVGTAEWVGQTALMGFLTLFFLFFAITGHAQYAQAAWGWVRESDRPRARAILTRMERAISGFVRGRILIALLLAVFYTIGFALIGAPAPLLVGVGISVLALVPYATLAALPVVMVLMALDGAGGLQGSWWWILLAPTALYQVGQALDDYLLTPRIQGTTTDLSTPAILFASFAGGLLAGFYGLLLAIPVAACARILFDELVRPRLDAWARGERADLLPLED